jgi:hypothetical protein
MELIFKNIYKILFSPEAAALGYVLGIIGLVYTLRDYYRNKGSILRIDFLPIFALPGLLPKDEDEMRLTFRKQPVNGLFSFLLLFRNAGDFDISRSDVSKPINIELPEGFEVIECNLAKASSQISVDTRLNENHVNVSFDLFKTGELFALEVIANNSTRSARFELKEVKITSRIKGLTKHSLAFGHPVFKKARARIDAIRNVVLPTYLLWAVYYYPSATINDRLYLVMGFAGLGFACEFIAVNYLLRKFRTVHSFVKDLQNIYKPAYNITNQRLRISD